MDTASLLSRQRCQSPSFLFDVVHSLTSKDNDFCCSSASVEQLHFKVQVRTLLGCYYPA